MPPLAQDRDTPRRDAREFDFPIAADAVIRRGALVCLNASGLAVRGAVATGLRTVGVAQYEAIASRGATRVRVERGCYQFRNSSGGDAIAAANIGATCFVADDDQVALTNGGGTRSAAGIVRDVDTQGVWVEI